MLDTIFYASTSAVIHATYSKYALNEPSDVLCQVSADEHLQLLIILIDSIKLLFIFYSMN